MTQDSNAYRNPQSASARDASRTDHPIDFDDLSGVDQGDVVDDDWTAEEASHFAAMVADAMDAPAVPKSLIKRLDRGIHSRWGSSPELSPSRLSHVSEIARTSVKTWPVVAALAASLLLVVFMLGGAERYAWATMVEAVKQQGVIQIASGDTVRWLDLSKQVVGRQTNESTEWIDLRDRSVSTLPSGTPSVQRHSLEYSGELSTELMLAAFLLDQPLSDETLQRLSGIHVVDQEWLSPLSDESRIHLNVLLESSSADRYELSIELDAQSSLPMSVQLTDGGSNVAATQDFRQLVYLNQSVEQLQLAHFGPGESVAMSDLTPEVERVDLTDAGSSTEIESAMGDRVTASTDPARAGSNVERDSSVESLSSPEIVSLPTGAANKWVPVTVVSRSGEEVIRAVDLQLQTLWEREQVQPVAAASDLQLLRRAYLDLAGRTPSVVEVREFMKDQSSDRYVRLIDRLLDSPDHASQMAAVWRSFLIPEGVDLDAFGGREAFERWLSERFASGEPYDQTVRKLLLAEGRLSRSGPLLFYSALKLDADQIAAKTSRAFLGMRLECAQCHDHPFEPWTQEDFWSYAAFFAQISRPRGELENVSTVMQVRDVDRGEVMIPETEIVAEPRFLGQTDTENDPSELARRAKLADWLTGPDNPYFARATANRLWSHFFGIGIVDPVDDFGVMNEPVSPELLDTLASQLIDTNFDLKSLIRSIVLSRAYQLSSGASLVGDQDEQTEKRLKLFAQMNVKTLTAEQLYDCIAVATMLDQSEANASDYSINRFGNGRREEFLQQFSAPASNRSEYMAGIPQALMLMNGSLTSEATAEQNSGLIRSLQAPFFTNDQRIEIVFMATMSRPPRKEELALVANFVPEDASVDQRNAGMADLLWALINSSEFALNH
ncbi:MAG: DUF1549 and DUF1553 domain-containing protein [Planctomycetota bacterium]